MDMAWIVHVLMRIGANVNDSRRLTSLQVIKQQICQHEVPQMISSKLHFKILFGELLLGNSHNSSIIYKNVKPFIFRFENFDKLLD